MRNFGFFGASFLFAQSSTNSLSWKGDSSWTFCSGLKVTWKSSIKRKMNWKNRKMNGKWYKKTGKTYNWVQPDSVLISRPELSHFWPVLIPSGCELRGKSLDAEVKTIAWQVHLIGPNKLPIRMVPVTQKPITTSLEPLHHFAGRHQMAMVFFFFLVFPSHSIAPPDKQISLKSHHKNTRSAAQIQIL